MLDCEAGRKKKEMAVRCLEVLCLAKDNYWQCILDAGTIPSLINLLKSNDIVLECITVGVLSNISINNPIARALVEAGGIPVLIKLLDTDEPELLSRCAVLLYDIAQLDDNQVIVAEQGAIPALVNLLQYDLEDLLVNVINCIRVLCLNNNENQLRVKETNGIEPLVNFLNSDSDVLLAVASAAIAELARGNFKMQNAIAETNVIGPLVELLRGRKISVQVKGAMAIEALCEKNSYIQMRFLAKSVTRFLLKLLKVFYLRVKEQGAAMLWALAGQTLKQQKFMAEQIGYNLIIDMLLSPSDRMQCVGEANISNPISQENVVDEGALPILVHLLKTHHSLQIKVRTAVASALGYLTFNRTAYRQLLVQCRNKPKLFKKLIGNLSRDARINTDFVKEFRRQKKIGLPSLSLEINGGPPAVPIHTRDKSRSTGVKLYKVKCRPKDSLFLMPTTHLMGRLRSMDKPRVQTTAHYPFPHVTTSDLIQVSRPRIVNVSVLRRNLPEKKT